MFRIWGKIMKRNKFIEDSVFEIDDNNISIDDKIQAGLENLCQFFDLEKPIWLDKNTIELARFSKTAFRQDQFMEAISFDYLELELIDDGKKKE
jgi:hypothetical protein